MRFLRYILPVMAAFVLFSCTENDRSLYMENDFIDNGGLKGSYQGVWSIDGQENIPSEVTVYDTGFSFKVLPVEAVLKAMLPGHDIKPSEEVGYMVPYDETGYTEQAMYYSVHPEQWTLKARIDGVERTVVIHFVSHDDDYAYNSIATYSKLSGVYKIVLHMRGIEIYGDNVEEGTYEQDRNMKLTFVTKKKI